MVKATSHSVVNLLSKKFNVRYWLRLVNLPRLSLWSMVFCGAHSISNIWLFGKLRVRQ